MTIGNGPARPGLVRTAVPIILALLVQQGIDLTGWIDNTTLTIVVSAVVTWLYYLGVRILERFSTTKWGWLLGWPQAPTYGGAHRADIDRTE